MDRTELFIRAFSTYHADEIKNRRGCWKRGDPVLAYPAGFARGRCERLPRFWRVALLAPVWAIDEYLTEHWHNAVLRDPHERIAPDKLDYWARRKHTFDPRLLPLSERTALYDGQIVDLDWATFTGALFVKDPHRIWTLQQAAQWHTNRGHRHIVNQQYAYWFQRQAA